MGTAADAIIQYEASSIKREYTEMTDSGDATIFKFGTDKLISKRSGYEPVIRPNGIIKGFNLLTPAASGTNNLADCAAFSAYFAGVEVAVSADTDLTCVRGSVNGYIINSVVCNSSGVLSVVTGDEGTEFSSTRGDTGGPPSIPIGSIEVGQVKFTSITDAAVAISEIAQSAEANQQERADYPLWNTPNTVGDGNQATDADKENAYLQFYSAIPMIHGATPGDAATARKPVYAEWHIPVLATIPDCVDFVPAEESSSVSSTTIYRKSLASSSKSLAAASFTAYMTDGITDQLQRLDGDELLFKFFQDENKEPYIVTQGIMGGARSFPADNEITKSVTIAARTKSVNFDS